MSAVDSRHPSQKKRGEADGRWQFPNEIKATRDGRGKPQDGNVVNLRGHDHNETRIQKIGWKLDGRRWGGSTTIGRITFFPLSLFFFLLVVCSADEGND